MNYSGDRSVRRARTRTVQSCEMVGLLYAEERALKRALTASLASSGSRTRAKDRVITVTDDSDEEDHALSDHTPSEAPGTSEGIRNGSNSNATITEAGTREESDSIGACRILDETESPLTRLPLKRLTSPTFSDEDSTSSNVGHTSSSASIPSTPPRSNQSPPALRLYVSSSSSPTSSSLSDSASREWNPQSSSKDGTKKKAAGPKKRKRKGSGKGAGVKGLHERGNGVSGGKPTSAKRSKVVVEDEENGGEVGDSGGGGDGDVWRDPLGEEKEVKMEDSYHLPQRKFASDHAPPVRYLSSGLKVKECKKLPKTEDFISYLCLRGSGDIPKHLQKFASPWTPRSRKVKSTKNRNKGPKNKSVSVTSKKLLITKSGP